MVTASVKVVLQCAAAAAGAHPGMAAGEGAGDWEGAGDALGAGVGKPPTQPKKFTLYAQARTTIYYLFFLA